LDGIYTQKKKTKNQATVETLFKQNDTQLRYRTLQYSRVDSDEVSLATTFSDNPSQPSVTVEA